MCGETQDGYPIPFPVPSCLLAREKNAKEA